MTFFRLLFFAAGILAGTIAGAQRPTVADGRASGPQRDVANYVLQPSDVVQMKIFQEPDLDRTVRVSADNSIVLPLIGSISVRGMTVRELEGQIREKYNRDFLVNPQVNIDVLEYAPRTVNVIGQVNSPGPIVIPPEENLRLIDAITRAGGPSRLARMSQVTLTRTLPDGKTQVFTIDADQLMRGRSSEPWFLQKDDVIFVPEIFL